MATNVKATRMELQKKKKNYKMAKRGHKLLKEKRDGLMQKFMEVIWKVRALREEVEEKLLKAITVFLSGSAYVNPAFLKESLAYSDYKVSIDVKKKNIMGVKIPEFKLNREGKPYSYGLTETTGDLDLSLKLLDDILPLLIELTRIEKTAQLMAEEIESTRRRVNALEYILIPELQGAIRYITMRLGELERQNLTMLMKVKEIVAAEK
ncbi:MAG: V-type ATP synthase subunit D [Candidatus Eremiobacteraeota bacterium]|nr:V-type ATP synthase subunit D [Candidatus Eremiobacteraeota bacterium]